MEIMDRLGSKGRQPFTLSVGRVADRREGIGERRPGTVDLLLRVIAGIHGHAVRQGIRRHDNVRFAVVVFDANTRAVDLVYHAQADFTHRRGLQNGWGLSAHSTG
ncbi:hypothetical protein D3C71_1809850 [compost metagenome]